MKNIKITLAVIIGISSLTLTAQKATVNVEKSNIEWLGKKVKGQHNGHILLKSGFLELKDGNIEGGEFVIDMTSITCDDVKNKPLNKKLVGHLESEDFFDVANYPTAKLVIKKSSDFMDGKATVSGDITIRGKTEAITFETVQNANNYLTTLEIDRSKFEVKYGSKSFFKDLGDKTINDIFTLSINLNLN